MWGKVTSIGKKKKLEHELSTEISCMRAILREFEWYENPKQPETKTQLDVGTRNKGGVIQLFVLNNRGPGSGCKTTTLTRIACGQTSLYGVLCWKYESPKEQASIDWYWLITPQFGYTVVQDYALCQTPKCAYLK